MQLPAQKSFLLLFLFPLSLLSQTPVKNPPRSLLVSPVKKQEAIPQTEKKYKIIIENVESPEWIKGEEQSQNVIRFFGRIKVTLETGYLYANEVVIDTLRKELFAYGNIEYIETGARVRAEKFIYDYERGYGIFYNGNGYREPLHFVGLTIRGLGENRFSVSDAYFTTCVQEKPHTHFTAKKVVFTENNEVIAIGVIYHVGGVPLIPLPFYYSSPWGTGIITQLGYSNLYGYFVNTTYQFSVPGFYLYSILPVNYRWKLDYYEKKGYYFGVELYRYSQQLSYVIDLALAEYKRYEFQPDIREKDFLRITNRLPQKDGTFAEEKYKWTKFFTLLTYNRQDKESNRVQKLTIRSLNYTHRLFEYEFGGRFVPTSTIPAIFQVTDANRGPIQNQTEYVLYYNDKIDDLTLDFQIARVNIWRESQKFPDSKYIPASDTLPNITIRKNVFLGYLFSLPWYWNNLVHYNGNRIYSNGKPYYFQHYGNLETTLRTTISFFPFFSFSPGISYGGQKYAPSKENISDAEYNNLLIFARKQSYEYLKEEHHLTLGPDFLYLDLLHTRKLSLREELRDRPAIVQGKYNDREKINQTRVKLNFLPAEFFSLSVESNYDHKKTEFDRPYLERWTYPVIRTELYVNFLNPFRPSQFHLLSKKRIHVAEMRITNDYVRDHLRSRDHSNYFGISFVMANFDLRFFKRLRYYEAGFYWYHVFYRRELDHMRFLTKLDLQLTKRIYFEMELESRLTHPEKYASRTQNCRITGDSVKCIPEAWIPSEEKSKSFLEDIIDSTGIRGKEKRLSSAFNIGYFQGSFIFDLHDWEFRIGYELQQKSAVSGINRIGVVNYYDNIVFFSVNFVKWEGIQSISRFIVDRRRVNAANIAKTQFYTQ